MLTMTKDKRLQIRVTEEELKGINRRAKAAGLSVAEYGRRQLLFGDEIVLPVQDALAFEDPGLSREEILEPDDPEEAAERRQILEEGGYSVPDWTPTIPGRTEKKCDVENVPFGVRCIKCGELHGS
jgi:Mobilization protein NikA